MTYTPGRAAHESLRETGAATFGRPVDNFPAWEAIPEGMRDRMAAAGHAELAAYTEANGGDPSALAVIAEAAKTPGYWYVRAALATAVGALQHVKLGTNDGLAALARETLAKVDETMQAAPDAPDDRTAGLMPMGLRFADADPVAVCLVGDCKWHGHGDAMIDATTAWTQHLAKAHRLDWPED